MPQPALMRRAVAEAIGTFALVFAGCGAIVTDAQRDGALGVVGVGLVFFLVLLAAIASLGHVSGAHFNPGVSLSFFLTRHLPARDLGAYWIAQLGGATLAALCSSSSGLGTQRTSGQRFRASPPGVPSSSRWC
jgi:glycerol uptake facilitator-like aquaporin